MHLIQKAAVVFGGTYFALGVIGFAVTGFTGWLEASGDQLIIFAINPFHNLVHIAVGALWVLGALLPQRGAAAGVFLGIGSVYLAASVLGFLGALPILGIESSLAPVNFFHLVTAVAAIAVAATMGDWQQESVDHTVEPQPVVAGSSR